MSGVTTISLAEWQAEMERRGKLDCKFVCPVCGNVASPNDWKALLPDLEHPDRAARECIGRAMAPDRRRRAFLLEEEADAPPRPCDYAAFGLFNLCKSAVQTPDGASIPVFEFALSEPERSQVIEAAREASRLRGCTCGIAARAAIVGEGQHGCDSSVAIEHLRACPLWKDRPFDDIGADTPPDARATVRLDP